MSLISEFYGPDELVLILNQLSKDKYENLVLEVAPFGFPLFEVRIKSNIFLTANTTPFSQYFSNNSITIPAAFEKEIDNGNPWNDVLKSAGIVTPSNIDEIKKTITAEFESNPISGDPPTLLCMDTNLFRHRLYTHTISRFLQEKSSKTLKSGFLLSETVQTELRGFSRKYKDADLKAILGAISPANFSTKDAKTWFNLIVNDFFNQTMLTDRKIRLGNQDFLRCLDSKFALIAPAVPNPQDPDFCIIDEIKAFAQSKQHRVLLLSEDKDCISRAQGLRQIAPALVVYPAKNNTPDKFKLTWYHLAQLLYCSAVWFGGVLLSEKQNTGNESILALNGIWKGKEPKDWNNEYIKVSGSPDFLADVNSDLNLIREAKTKLH